MSKLGWFVVTGAAVAAMGCQEQQAQRPPATPQASAQPAPPPGPPGPPQQQPHAWGGPPGHGGPGWGPPPGAGGPPPGQNWHHGDGGGMARHEGGPHHDGSGDHMGHKERRPEHGGPRGGQEMMRELAMLGVHFYAPPQILRRAKDINLTPDQAQKLRDEMLGTKKKAIDLHAKIEHARVEMIRLLATDKVDEKAVAAQVDEAAKAEAEMHKLHVASMLRVRALLTPEQRQKLDEHHAKRNGGAGGQKHGEHGRPGPVGMADDDDDDDEDDES